MYGARAEWLSILGFEPIECREPLKLSLDAGFKVWGPEHELQFECELRS